MSRLPAGLSPTSREARSLALPRGPALRCPAPCEVPPAQAPPPSPETPPRSLVPEAKAAPPLPNQVATLRPGSGCLSGLRGSPEAPSLSMAAARNLRTALIFGGFISLVGAAFYPIYFRPLMRLEEYQKEQAVNRAGIVQEDVQPPGLKVWSDPFGRK